MSRMPARAGPGRVRNTRCLREPSAVMCRSASFIPHPRRRQIVNDTGFLYTAFLAISGWHVAFEREFSLRETPASSIEQSAFRLAKARLTVTPLTDFPGSLPTDLSSAYDCQQRALAHWPQREPAGLKVARIAPAWQQQFPEERLIGPILAGHVYRSSGEVLDCPVIDGGFAAVEAELGIHVAADAPAGKQDWTPESAVSMVARLCIGVEIASSPMPQINDLGPGAVISDFGNNWGAIAGADLEGWRTLHAPVEVQTRIDGAVVGRATILVPETPLAALAFALNKSAQLGQPLRAGQYISTGMITGVHDIRVGQEAQVTFGENGERGEIRCRMIRAQPEGSSL